MDVNLGYSVVSLSLLGDNIMPYRKSEGDYFQQASSLIENLKDLQELLAWNESNGIKFYRLSNNLAIPGVENLPRQEEIQFEFMRVGDYAREHNHRLSFHCSHYAVLCSPKEYVQKKTLDEIESQSRVFDLMGYEPSHWNKINIHVGGAYGNKSSALEHWVRSWEKLSDSAKQRLVVENDDKPSLFGVQDLYDGIHRKIKVPITFDVFHHNFCNVGESHEEAAKLAASTWETAVPCFHFASSRTLNESASLKTAHADWVYEDIEDWGTGAWIMVESRARDLAVINYTRNGKGAGDKSMIETLIEYDKRVPVS